MTDVYYLPIVENIVKPADKKYYRHDQLLKIHIHRQTNKIHHDNKPAMQFPNGISVWVLQGIPYRLDIGGQYYTVFSPNNSNKKWQFTSTRKIENTKHIRKQIHTITNLIDNIQKNITPREDMCCIIS